MEGSEGERRKAECIIWTFVDGGLSNKGRRTRAWQRDHLIISAPISRKQAPPSVVLCSRPTDRGPAAAVAACDVGGNGYEMHICSDRADDDRRTNERAGGSGFTRFSRIRNLDSDN